jgi:hypothetical protein
MTISASINVNSPASSSQQATQIATFTKCAGLRDREQNKFYFASEDVTEPGTDAKSFRTKDKKAASDVIRLRISPRLGAVAGTTHVAMAKAAR